MTEETNKDNFYLTGQDLFDEIIKCRINDHKISNTLGEMFFLLSTRYSNHRNFVRYYHIKQDLIAAGVEACCKAFYKFRPYKDKEIVWDEQTSLEFDHNIHNNSFAYFTTAIHHNFLAIVKKEYAQSNILNEMRLNNDMDASFGYLEMMSDKEEKERAERLEEEGEDIRSIRALSFDEQSVWDDYGPDDNLVEEAENDDDTIDWQEVMR